MVGHVWGDVVRVGAYAWRLNLMSACFSAAGAGCLFLVVHRLLEGEDTLTRVGGAAAAALVSAFTFTGWQNSNETEVYTVATFSIAAICWLCLRWRDARGSDRAAHYLLLIVYLAALSVGNHLLTLLVMPAVSVFVFVTLRTAPAADPGERRVEWAEWAAVSALWILLVGVGLGNTTVLVVAGLLFAAALVLCIRAGSLFFPVAAVVVAAVGVSTYAFLYIRSGLQPALDEADPETWHRLLAVIRREQYGARGLLDHPAFDPGPDNPGRTLTVFAQQLVNYAQYFAWQWGRSLKIFALVPMAIYALLGAIGWSEAYRRDRGSAFLLGTLWLATGLGLVVYMNFKAGFSLFWDKYLTIAQHEVRERDYFFTVSFQVWGLVAGIGVVRLVRAWQRAGRWALATAAALAVLPFALNFSAASRRHGPDATIARDLAYNMLQSVEPYGVLFTYGDNDTFPLWYIQEVEGVRQDVTLINLSLAQLDWYGRQLVTRPIRRFDPAGAPAVYRALAPPGRPIPGPPLHLRPGEVDSLRPIRVGEGTTFRGGGVDLPIRAGQVFQVRDLVILYTIGGSLPGRPVTFGVSSGRGSWLGLDQHLVAQGLAYSVFPGRPDADKRFVAGIQGTMLDTTRTRLLVDSVFQYGGLLAADSLDLDPAARAVANSMAIPLLELGNAAAQRRDQARALVYLRRAYHLSPTPALAAVLQQIESQGVQSLFRP
jgi:hypothetical protein